MSEDTYAGRIRAAMRSFDPPVTRRALKKRMTFSYEHIRKVIFGMPLQSERFNEEVCEVLHLDKREMWQVAMREKLQTKGPEFVNMAMPDNRLKDLWFALDAEDQERLLLIARGLVEQRAIERNEHEEDDPDMIRERINFLMKKLTPGAVKRSSKRVGMSKALIASNADTHQ